MINKSNSNPNNRVRLASKVNRNSSHLIIKQHEATSRVGTPREANEELSKIRKTSFWMKKVIGGQANELKPQKPYRDRQIRSSKVLSVKVKT